MRNRKSECIEKLIRKTTLSEVMTVRPLVLHSDNGSPMEATILEKLGVQSSFSKPRVSNDNLYLESLFKIQIFDKMLRINSTMQMSTIIPVHKTLPPHSSFSYA
ncbi:hypothetical protein CIW83_05455 [Tissierella sp. P1]|uniref:hypothetical protein n=1 Tax=Tissierella sp. P1 TaxID=1280483 RepID=UPI000BA0DC79|nr:hypothetical protein [Tissierella sp. P1]OZV12993.1 hypothetical protein CIW83_05455 [Tissierella sp. P1]